MNPRLLLGRSLSVLGVLACVSLLAFSPAQLLAESKGKATTGKIYVAGTEGGAQVAERVPKTGPGGVLVFGLV
jgi:hypothetical protein